MSISIIDLEYLFLSFMLYSFGGWLYETFICSLWEFGHFANRGSLLGPYCPVYGVGSLISILMAQLIPGVLPLFLISATLCIVAEYIAACVLENVFHMKLWDYTGMAFQLQGRICLLGFLFFGLASTFISRLVQPALMGVLVKMPIPMLHAVTIICLVVFFGDILLSCLAFLHVSRKLFRFYVHWHAMLNREFRSLSRAIARRLPDWVLEDLSGMQNTILEKNRILAAKEMEQREAIMENLQRFRKS